MLATDHRGTDPARNAANDAVVVEVVPVADSETEIHGVYLRLAEANPGAPFYCAKDRRYNRPWDALVKIYDGPEYTAVELSDMTFSQPGYSSYGGYRYPASTDSRDAFCLNNASPYPMIGGSAHYPNNVYGPEQHFEGYWSSGGYGTLNDITGQRSGTGFIQMLTGISDTGALSGIANNEARCIRSGTSYPLPRAIPPEAYPSAVAEGISPDGNQIPGWIVYDGSGSSWPVVWNFLGNGYARNWIALSGTPTVVPTGKTLAANNAGEAVGWFIRTSPGAAVRRAFRTLGTSPTTIHPTDELPPPVDASQDTSEALAIIGPNPVDDRGNGYAPLEQLAVGKYVRAVGVQTAIAWKKRPTISSKAVPVNLGSLRDPNLEPFKNSEAIGVNRYGRIVGASWGSINYPLPSSPLTLWSRAFVASGPVEDSVRDLNDQHFVRKDPSWVLERAVAINDNNYIVCVGQNQAGVTRAYLLIPRIPGN